MKITKIKIKDLFGIQERELDGKSVEFSGTNGVGKTSIIDAIKLGLNNEKSRDLVVRNGADEGEIIIETDSSLSINRKVRTGQADYKAIKEDNKAIKSAESYLRELFTDLQLDPIKFVSMSAQEQNRALLSLIQFKWDENYIIEKFGELPQGVNYDQHILKVLEDIQSEKGLYYQSRQSLNREIKIKQGNNADLVKEIPDNYQYEKWSKYPLAEKFTELTNKRKQNSLIERAKSYNLGYQERLKNIELERDNKIQIEKEFIANETQSLNERINKYKSEIQLLEEKLKNVGNGLEDKILVINSEFNESKARLDLDNAKTIDYINMPLEDLSALEEETAAAGEMIKHVNTYERWDNQRKEIDSLQELSDWYTCQIQIARNLPSEILPQAIIPVKGLTVKDGVALIDKGDKGLLPVSNLSEGEKLDLCVDVTIQNPQGLKIILIDGVEKLSEENRMRIYARCKAAGLQFIATRTTDDNELEAVYF